MEKMQKVEKLREKAGVTYEEAKRALEACDYDVLDALVYLEKLGLIESPKVSSYTTTSKDETSQEFDQAQKKYEDDCNGTSASELFSKFFKWCGKVIKKGCETTFNVVKEGKEIMSVPVIVLVLATLLAFWLVLILLVVGMFNDCKYYFKGFEKTTVDINEICEKASQTCENIKNDFQNK